MFFKTSLNPIHVLTLAGLFAAPVLGLTLFHPTPLLLLLAYLHLLWFGFASSLYYHRVLSHRAAKLVPALELFFLLGGLIGLSGDPVQWSSVHRFHHQNSDSDEDPHSPKRGFWHSLFGWYLRVHPTKIEPILGNSSELAERKIISWARGYGPSTIIHIAYAVLLYIWGGFPALVWVLYIPVIMSFFMAWALVASFCHIPFFGKQPYPETRDRSRNVALMAPFTFGESFHNTHHRYSSVGLYSEKWTEWDMSGYLLVLFEKLGWAKDLRRLPK